MEVVIDGKVSKHNNTLVLFFAGKDTVLQKQVHAVTACAKVADSWGNRFGGHAVV